MSISQGDLYPLWWRTFQQRTNACYWNKSLTQYLTLKIGWSTQNFRTKLKKEFLGISISEENKEIYVRFWPFQFWPRAQSDKGFEIIPVIFPPRLSPFERDYFVKHHIIKMNKSHGILLYDVALCSPGLQSNLHNQIQTALLGVKSSVILWLGTRVFNLLASCFLLGFTALATDHWHPPGDRESMVRSLLKCYSFSALRLLVTCLTALSSDWLTGTEAQIVMIRHLGPGAGAGVPSLHSTLSTLDNLL